jgi:hypothetical protein
VPHGFVVDRSHQDVFRAESRCHVSVDNAAVGEDFTVERLEDAVVVRLLPRADRNHADGAPDATCGAGSRQVSA